MIKSHETVSQILPMATQTWDWHKFDVLNILVNFINSTLHEIISMKVKVSRGVLLQLVVLWKYTSTRTSKRGNDLFNKNVQIHILPYVNANI